MLGALDDVGVVAAAQTPVAGDGEQGDRAHLAGRQQGSIGGFEGHAGLQALQNPGEAVGEGPASQHLLLGTAHFGGRHQTHGLGDLACVLDRTDAVADLLEIGHGWGSSGGDGDRGDHRLDGVLEDGLGGFA